MNLPYYQVQKEVDNGVSYYTSAPKESYGLSIPLLYGDFLSNSSARYNDWMLANTICTDNRYLQFAIASHKCNALGGSSQLLKYMDGANTYMILIPDDGEDQNNDAGCFTRLYNNIRTADTRIYGELLLQMNIVGGKSEVNDIENVINTDQTDYMTLSNALASNYAAFKLDINLSDSDVGILDTDAADVTFQVDWACDAAANRDIVVSYYHDVLGAWPLDPSDGVAKETHNATTQESTAINIGAYTGLKIADDNGDVTLPWTIEELVGMEWTVGNLTAISGTENIRIYCAFLHLTGILVSGIIGRKRGATGSRSRGGVR
jgi:hypothetical protein